ncbi:MAG: hypothetical protein H6665_01060 [Ardenticatenaceae bacterium]|nr:hypothetical protein [Ardenticatenaceae bacterium]MCB8989181.1 hypothetical protein [Ardenticatenaceae bacterium]
MTNEQPIKIIIPPEEDAAVEEPVLVPERPSRNPSPQVKQVAGAAGKQVVGVAKKAWDTDARRKVTGGMKRGATAVAAKGTKLVQDKVVETAERQAREQAAAMQTRIKETDWKAEAQSGTAKALQWLSTSLSNLAARLTPAKEPPTPGESPTPPDTQDL